MSPISPTRQVTRLILVRHGQTDWNLGGRYQGRSDVPLNATGREQAAQLAVDLASVRIDAVYCSPLSRSLETARAVAEGRWLKVHLDPRLTEIDQGEWEGKTAAQIAADYPELFRRWQEDPRSVHPPGGESIQEVHHRVVAAVEEMVAAHPDGTLCVVAHKTAMVVMRCHYRHLDIQEEMGKMPQNAAWEALEVAPGSGESERCCSVTGRGGSTTRPH